MLEKIKVLKTKGEILLALIAISSDESEVKEHKRALNSVKNELLKMLENLTPQKNLKNENGTAKNLDDILAENGLNDDC